MLLGFRFLLVVLFTIAFRGECEIFEVSDLKQFEEQVDQLNTDDLVIFDVDYTLIAAEDAILRPAAGKLAQKLTSEILRNPAIVPVDKYEPGHLNSIILSQGKFILVDESAPEIIKKIQKREIKAIALTALNTGRYGVIPWLEDWRIKQLDELGINFNLAFPENPLVSLPQFSGVYKPLFKQGILFSSRYSKGEVLSAFLKKLNWRPQKIVFIDDKLSFIQSVESEMAKYGIPVISFLYSGGDSLPLELNEKWAELQFRHLAEHEEWLSDKEAKERLMRSLTILLQTTP